MGRMNKTLTTMVLGIGALALLVVAAPVIACLVNALVPLVLAVGLVAALLRAVWFYTR
jgi:hypothetical protein